MDKVQKIRDEIVRLKDDLIKAPNKSEIDLGRISAFEDILLYIDSLHEEPASEDLEEAAAKYDRVLKVYNEHKKLVDAFSREYFKFGANWQKKQLIDKACKWLEENLKITSKYHHPTQDGRSVYLNMSELIEAFNKAMEG